MSSFLISALRIAAFGLFLGVFISDTAAQSSPHPVADWLAQKSRLIPATDFRIFEKAEFDTKTSKSVSNAAFLQLDENALILLRETAPERLNLFLPVADNNALVLELAKVDIFGPEFKVGTLGTFAEASVPYQPGVHYRGIVRGKDGSLAAVSLSSSGVMGLVTDETGNYTLGALEGQPRQYIFYESHALGRDNPTRCMVEDEHTRIPQPDVQERNGACGGAVQIYFECDYRLFSDKGGDVTQTTDYVTGLFNQVATLYARDNISVAVSEIYVWTSSDPYASYGSTASVLNVFRSTKGVQFNGNLAHFLTTRNLGGGIAYLDVICSKSNAFGVSAISTSYRDVPAYSWSVEVVTHELGHNLGSPHTQSCSWPGGPIDNCVSQEGACSPGPTPVNGGTIMSYCHLTSIGINLSNGFGPLPGDRIRSRIAAASCLSGGSTGGASPTGLQSSNITASSAQLSWSAGTTGSTYTVQYKAASATAWQTSNPMNTTSFALTGLQPSTTYQWQVKNGCSAYSTPAQMTTTAGASVCVAPTGLGNSNIGNNSALCTWNAVQGATQYTVEMRLSGASIWTAAGTTALSSYALSGLMTARNYEWRVKANCSGFSAVISFTTTQTSTGGGGTATCAAPANLTGTPVSSTSARLSWQTVTNAGSYFLQIRRKGATSWFSLGSTTLISVRVINLAPATTYEWRVKAVCSAYSATATVTTPGNLPGAENNEEVPAGNLRLYPNPVADVLHLEYEGALPAETHWCISDAAGHRIRQGHSLPDFGVLDVSALPAGLYFFQLEGTADRTKPQKFVKM
jgi:hypothetical protein